MRILKALIVDDERSARKELIFLLKAYPEIEIVAEAENISEAIAAIKEHRPDLVFLDIQLTGENGFDLLDRVALDFRVVFVTAFNEFAVKAFDVNASDYLLKPVDPARLALTIKKLFSKSEQVQNETRKFGYDDSVFLKLNNHTAKFIALNTILAISSVGNYSRLSTSEQNNYLALKTLNQWESELPGENFIRIHRSTIINIRYVSRIETFSETYHRVYLRNLEQPLDISREGYKKIRKKSL